jgi:hypothetical protein
MASLLEDADLKRALRLVADCSAGCRACGTGAVEGDRAAMADCVSGCLDCVVFCSGAEALLSRRSGFDVHMLWLAVGAAAT